MSATDPDDDEDRTVYETDEVYDEDAYAGNTDDEGRVYEATYEGEGDAYTEDEGDGLIGESLALLLFVVGLVLFLFPEPGTSTLGIFLMIGAVVVWAADALL